MSDQYLTVQEVAEDLGVVPESVRRYIREKKWGVASQDLQTGSSKCETCG